MPISVSLSHLLSLCFETRLTYSGVLKSGCFEGREKETAEHREFGDVDGNAGASLKHHAEARD